MSFKVHIIHDLFYGFNEPTSSEDLTIPDVDLVIMNGNLGWSSKRSWHYAFQVANLYPNIQFVFNDGTYERYLRHIDKIKDEQEISISTRKQNTDWPNNLHWKDHRDDQGLLIELQTGQTVAVWPCFGFPNIISYDDWEDTWFHKTVCQGQTKTHYGETAGLPNTDLRLFSDGIAWATPEWVKEKFLEQENKLRKWETEQIAYKHYGIVVTHLNPYKDPRLDNIKYSPYKMHLKGQPGDGDRLWVTSHQEKSVNFLGAKLCSNPGRGSIARGKVLEVD